MRERLLKKCCDLIGSYEKVAVRKNFNMAVEAGAENRSEVERERTIFGFIRPKLSMKVLFFFNRV